MDYLRARSSAPEARERYPSGAWGCVARPSNNAPWEAFAATEDQPDPAGAWSEIIPLYTHPAPDALRVAVEAAGFMLDRLSDLEQDVNERDFYGHVHPAASRLRQALAALQAEQKGGA